MTETTSVNGNRLAERLTVGDAEVTVAGYEPDRFVHAKLVGVTAGRRAWLLSGSPNISRHAPTLTAATHGRPAASVAVSDRNDPISDCRGATMIFVPAGEEHRFIDVTEDLVLLVVFSPACTGE